MELFKGGTMGGVLTTFLVVAIILYVITGCSFNKSHGYRDGNGEWHDK